MNTVKQIEKQITDQKESTHKLHEQLKKAQERQTVKCAACQKRSKVGDWELFVKLYYVPPSGCMEGDYSRESELAIKCPKCEFYNRPFGKAHVDFVKERRYIFINGGTGYEYPGRWVNWYTADFFSGNGNECPA